MSRQCYIKDCDGKPCDGRARYLHKTLVTELPVCKKHRREGDEPIPIGRVVGDGPPGMRAVLVREGKKE